MYLYFQNNDKSRQKYHYSTTYIVKLLNHMLLTITHIYTDIYNNTQNNTISRYMRNLKKTLKNLFLQYFYHYRGKVTIQPPALGLSQTAQTRTLLHRLKHCRTRKPQVKVTNLGTNTKCQQNNQQLSYSSLHQINWSLPSKRGFTSKPREHRKSGGSGGETEMREISN